MAPAAGAPRPNGPTVWQRDDHARRLHLLGRQEAQLLVRTEADPGDAEVADLDLPAQVEPQRRQAVYHI